MDLRRSRRPVHGRHRLRRLSDRQRRAGGVPARRFGEPLPHRRERRTARQVPANPRPGSRDPAMHRPRPRGAARFRRRANPVPRRPLRDRPRGARPGPRPLPARGRGFPPRRYRDPDLHLRHHRQAQGRDDLASQHPLLGGLGPGRAADAGGGRAALLPAALPRARTAGIGVRPDRGEVGGEFRGERRDGVRQSARSLAGIVHRGSPDLGKDPFADLGDVAGSHRDRTLGLCAGPGMRHGTRRISAGGAAGPAAAEAALPALGLAGAGQSAAHGRPRRRPLHRDRGGADIARARQVVLGDRPRHAGRLRPDRERGGSCR